MRRFLWMVLFIFPFFAASQVNLAHLDFLGQVVEREGEEVLLVHIYCEYPDYRWVDAAGEGITCVDDVARAAVVYVEDFRMTGEERSLRKLRQALNFVMQMQAPDGEFYNFVNSDLEINRNGATSRKSVDFWAARAVWAMGHAYTVFLDRDVAYAQRLRVHIRSAIAAVDRFMEKHPGSTRLPFGEIPEWLTTRGSDCWSIFLLGMLDYYSKEPDEALRASIKKIADGIAVCQAGNFDDFPLGAHLSWGGAPDMWHGWGNRQTQALAYGYRLLGDKNWLASTQREAAQFYTFLLVSHMLGSMNPHPVMYEQIAYTVSPIAEGLLELSRATGEQEWAKLAGLAAGWFYGNNPAGIAMYDPASGRCFDGLRADATVNRNSGAESTIEALLALLYVENHPLARRYLHYLPSSTNSAVFVPLAINQKESPFFLHLPGDYTCYYCGPTDMTPAVDGVRFPQMPDAYPAMRRFPETRFLAAGIHTMSRNSASAASFFMLRPLVERKHFENEDRFLTLVLDRRRRRIEIRESDSRSMLAEDFTWKKE